MIPKPRIVLAAGRATLSEADQTLCFLAGANSIFLGEKLLTAKNNIFAIRNTTIEDLWLIW